MFLRIVNKFFRQSLNKFCFIKIQFKHRDGRMFELLKIGVDLRICVYHGLSLVPTGSWFLEQRSYSTQ